MLTYLHCGNNEFNELQRACQFAYMMTPVALIDCDFIYPDNYIVRITQLPVTKTDDKTVCKQSIYRFLHWHNLPYFSLITNRQRYLPLNPAPITIVSNSITGCFPATQEDWSWMQPLTWLNALAHLSNFPATKNYGKIKSKSVVYFIR